MQIARAIVRVDAIIPESVMARRGDLMQQSNAMAWLLHRAGATPLRIVGSVAIGRDAGCAVFIDDPKVSRRHCRLDFVDGRLVVADESSNGTLLNEQKLDGVVAIQHGDVIQVGGHRLTLEETRTSYDGAFRVEVVETPSTGPRYRDAFRVDDGSAYAVMVEPLGEGALFVPSSIKPTVRAASARALAPDAVLRTLNQELVAAGVLATACCARLEPSESLLTIACAGALPPWVLRKNQRAVLPQASASIALGRLGTSQFVSRALHFELGDTLLVGSASWAPVLDEAFRQALPLGGIAEWLRGHRHQPADGCVLLVAPS